MTFGLESDLVTAAALYKKYYYGQKVFDSLINRSVFLSDFKKGAEGFKFTGNQGVIAIRTGYSMAPGFRGEGQDLPLAGSVSAENATFVPVYFYAPVQISGPGKAQAANDAGAFVRTQAYEVDSMKDGAQKILARYFAGFGDAIITTITAQMTIPAIGADSASTAIANADFLRFAQGMLVDISDGNQSMQRARIKSVVRTGTGPTGTMVVTNVANLTVATAGPIASGATIVNNGESAAGVNTPCMGMPGIIDDYSGGTTGLISGNASVATLQGILRTQGNLGANFWNAGVFGTKTGAMSEVGLQQMIDYQQEINSGDPQNVRLFSSYAFRRALFSAMKPDRRFAVESKVVKYTGGMGKMDFSGIDFCGFPWFCDDIWPRSVVHSYNRTCFRIAEVVPFKIMDEDGLMWRQVPGTAPGTSKDLWRAFYLWYFQLVAVNVNRNAAFLASET